MGVDKDELDRCHNSSNVLAFLKNAIKIKYNLDFIYDFNLSIGYGAKLQNGLIFTTHHIKGAEKFLMAIDKINDPTIFPMEDHLYEKLKKILNTPKTNIDIFKWGIKEGYLSKKVKKTLKTFEDEGKLNVKEINPSKKRNGGAYYLDGKEEKLKFWMKNDFKD